MTRNPIVGAVLLAVLAGIVPASATFPFPPNAGTPYDYTALRIANGACAPLAAGQKVPPGTDLPKSFDCRNHWKLSDYASQPGDVEYDPLVATNPQELYGIRGPGTNRAWEVTTGRPDTVIAVMDSGIRWSENTPELYNKFFLNIGELPHPVTGLKAGTYRDYDVNGDGVVNVRDFAGVATDFADDQNTALDPADLIRTFSDGVDDDGNGYTDDISGWDFFEGDNDAGDDVSYGHGTGESEDSAGEVDVTGTMPQCPNCMLLEMRVGDSFVADINHWAEAVVYAVDNGASVVQEALGTLNHTAFGQAAADYAWENGVLIVASEADESAGHHNYPAALNHTMVVNSVTKYLNQSGVPVQSPRTWLAFNGCTNFGGYTWVSVASTSCSSDATGQSSGMAGLLYSAAKNAVDLGTIAQRPDTAGRPLSASEAKQLFRIGADDVDFSTPKAPTGAPNNFATTIPGSQRFVTTASWDQITGWGRTNTNAMVRAVAAGRIPPEADLVAPRWWEPLPSAANVAVHGRVAAPRAGSYTYEVQFAPGVQPPRWPATDAWTTIASGSGTVPKDGLLAWLDTTKVRDALLTAPPPYTPADDPTSRDMPEQSAFRLRVVVRDDRPDTPDAIEQRQHFITDDYTLLAGFPRFLGADGASSPAFADLDGDGADELVLADGNGFVHAFTASGGEAPGFPVHTAPLSLPSSGSNAYTRGAMAQTVYAPVLLGSPAIADLDGDGTLDITVADIEGDLWSWTASGALRPGFPVRGNPLFSVEPGCQRAGAIPRCDDFDPARNARDRINTVDWGFTANPSAGDLDPAYPGLEIVAGSNDGHVYAWHADGTPVAGWPVLLRDPTKVASVDPTTHRVSFVAGSGVRFGRKVLTTPSLGDVDGDGDLEVAVNVNEEYVETPNWAQRDPVLTAIGRSGLVAAGNTRVYLLHHDGTAHAPSPLDVATPHPDDHAYVDGWPAKIGMVITELLPYVGEGSNGAPVMADVDGDGTLEIATASIAGPGYLLRANGSSYYGNGPDGTYVAMGTSLAEFKSGATDGPSIPSLGGGVFGRLGGDASPVSFVMGSTGLRRLLDVLLPEQQLGAEDHLGSWNAATGTFDAGFPAQVNDLMFFNTPAVADVDGDRLGDAITSTAMYDLRAYRAGGAPALEFPKFTGGWSVMTPAVGDLDGDGRREIALATREGNLFVWRTGAASCSSADWPKYQHDLRNTGAMTTDATRPMAIGGGVATRVAPGRVAVSVHGAFDDGRCGTAVAIEVTAGESRSRHPVGRDGSANKVLASDAATVSVRAIDDAGNLGPARVLTVR